jgi:hypothetical protein
MTIDREGIAQRPSKFKAVRTTVDGIKFASKKEAARYSQLLMLQRAGEIRCLERQVPIMLWGRDGPIKTSSGRHMRLTVDFAYEDKRLNWALVYEDAKGARTRDFDVRVAVAAAMGIPVLLT